MKIEITYDPDGVYEDGKLIEEQKLVDDYIDTLNEVEDADTISFLRKTEIAKAVAFVAKMWGLSYKYEFMTHYRVNVNHRSADSFCYFNDKKKMFDWISERVGENISSFVDIKKWNEKMYVGVAHARGCIEVESFKDLKDFFKYRRAYVLRLRLCDDLSYRMQRLGRCIKRNVMIESFSRSYEDANEYCNWCPAIWQGEI